MFERFLDWLLSGRYIPVFPLVLYNNDFYATTYILPCELHDIRTAIFDVLNVATYLEDHADWDDILIKLKDYDLVSYQRGFTLGGVNFHLSNTEGIFLKG